MAENAHKPVLSSKSASGCGALLPALHLSSGSNEAMSRYILDMAQATSLLLRLILALRRQLLRILTPQRVEQALTGILRRLAVLWRLFRSNFEVVLPSKKDR
jgi:hypothetical protein